MATINSLSTANATRLHENQLDLEAAAHSVMRYGLVAVLLWIGAMKFTLYEAQGIQGFLQNSPLFSWLNGMLSVRGISGLIGGIEIFIALLIFARPFSVRASALGGVLASGMFLSTLSFMITTPGVVEPSLGFPALSIVPGQFLVKDIALLGIALWVTAEALTRLRSA